MLDRRHYADRAEPIVESTAMGDEPSLFDNSLPSVGRDLRLAREATGASIEDVAAHLRIRADYIAAIEAEEFDKLPAPAYVTGFLRAYADCVGLDAQRVIAAYKTELSPGAAKTELVFPTPLDEPRRPRGLVIVGAFLVALMIYGAWSYVRTRDRLALDYVPSAPERLTALLGTTPAIETVTATRPQLVAAPEPSGGALAAAVDQAAMGESGVGAADASLVALAEARPAANEDVDAVPARPSDAQAMQAYLAPVTASPESPAPALAATAVDEPVDVQAEAAPETQAATTLAAPAPVASDTDDEAARPANEVQVAMTPPPSAPLQPPPAPVDTTAASEPPTVPRLGADGYAPQTYGMANANARVMLRALADSWVQVQGPNNELLLTRILRSGDTYRAPNRPDIVMMTGNAGALEVIVDGRPLGPLGSEGQVKRNVPLAAEPLVALVTNADN